MNFTRRHTLKLPSGLGAALRKAFPQQAVEVTPGRFAPTHASLQAYYPV
jgi:hypothetical protein